MIRRRQKALVNEENTRKKSMIYGEYTDRSHTPTTTCDIECTNGGRHSGTTNEKKLLYDKASISAKNDMTAKFMEEAKKTKNEKRMTNGMLHIIITDVHTKRKLPPDLSVSPATI